MAAWQILGLIVIAVCGIIVGLGFIDAIKTLPQVWNMIPEYEDDEF